MSLFDETLARHLQRQSDDSSNQAVDSHYQASKELDQVFRQLNQVERPRPNNDDLQKSHTADQDKHDPLAKLKRIAKALDSSKPTGKPKSQPKTAPKPKTDLSKSLSALTNKIVQQIGQEIKASHGSTAANHFLAGAKSNPTTKSKATDITQGDVITGLSPHQAQAVAKSLRGTVLSVATVINQPDLQALGQKLKNSPLNFVVLK